MSELSGDALKDQSHLGWDETATGLFLYLLDERPMLGGITVLASVPCHDAAFLIFDSMLHELAATKVGRRGSAAATTRRRSRQSADRLAACS